VAPTAREDDRGAVTRRRASQRRAPGIRVRIAIVVVTLVTATAIVLGVGAFAFVDASLRDQLRVGALRQADYDLGTLIPTALPGRIDRASLSASGLIETFRLRGDVETIVDFGDAQLFEGVTTYPAIVALRKTNDTEGDLRYLVVRGDAPADLGQAFAKGARSMPRTRLSTET